MVLDATTWDHGLYYDKVVVSLAGENVTLQEFNPSDSGVIKQFNLALSGQVSDLKITVAGTQMQTTIDDPTQAANIHVYGTSARTSSTSRTTTTAISTSTATAVTTC